MKKIFSIFPVLAASMFALTSCDPETSIEAGGTAVESMAGNWDVIVDVIEIDENGDSIHYGDYYGYGVFPFCTYNTTDNASDKLFVFEDDFWGTKIKCNCDLSANKIWADEAENLSADEETAKVVGKIIPGGSKSIHNLPIDSICIDIEYDSDPGFVYRYAGSRHTGFAE